MSIPITQLNKNLCCGCGVCAGICPKHALNMQLNERGEYNPVLLDECNSCGICLKSCPFLDINKNENDIGLSLFNNISGIHHLSETGYYLSSYVGHVSDEERRWKSASGGLATWFLEQLLVKKTVDAVLCVRKSDDGKHLYQFFIAHTPDEVRESAGSAYYPTEISDVLRYVLENSGRYAVIGVPCFVKALRLAQFNNKKLSERIVVIAGLTCGKMKSTKFTEHIAQLCGLKDEIKSVSFRCKSMDRHAGLYSYDFSGVNGNKSSIIWNQGISDVWSSTKFTVPACNYCDDIFAECADITFMDAWLPEYSVDSRGTSLVIVRSELADKVIKEGNDITVQPIAIEKVIQSQRGVIVNKREMLSYRLAQAKKHGDLVPKKRVSPAKFGGVLISIKMMSQRFVSLVFAVIRKIKSMI